MDIDKPMKQGKLLLLEVIGCGKIDAHQFNSNIMLIG